jgi:MATE family multidrug resistance protein
MLIRQRQKFSMKTRIRTEAAALSNCLACFNRPACPVGMGVADCDDRHFNAEELAASRSVLHSGLIVLVTVMGIMMAVNAVVSHVGAEQYERVPHIVSNR